MEALSDPPPTHNVQLNTVSTVDAAASVLRELILDGELSRAPGFARRSSPSVSGSPATRFALRPRS